MKELIKLVRKKKPIAERYCPQKNYMLCTSTLQGFYFSLLQALWLLPGQLREEIKSKEEALSAFSRKNCNMVVVTDTDYEATRNL